MNYVWWNRKGVHEKSYFIKHLKDARSVSQYPYNPPQMLQYVKYAKWINITKGIAKFLDKNVFWAKKTNTTKHKIKHKKSLPEMEIEHGTSRMKF